MRTDPPVAPQADLQQLAEKWRREAEIMVEPLMGAPIPTQAERVLAKALRDCANDLQAALASLGERAQLQGNEHAGGSLNGPSRLGASPNTDTGGECVLVPRSLLVSTLNLLGATELGLHGTPWAQTEIRALIRALDHIIPAAVRPQPEPPNRKHEETKKR